MTTAIASHGAHPSSGSNGGPPEHVERSVPLMVAGYASLGAGAIHAAAIGGHTGMPEVVRVFTIAAAFQIGWGAVALVARARPDVVGVGVLGNLALLAGWVLAKVSGLGFVDGFEEAQTPALADTAAALLAGVAVLGGVVSLIRGGLLSSRRMPIAVVAGVVVIALASAGMSSAASPSHHGTDTEATSASHHGTDAAATDDHVTPAAAAGGDGHDVAAPIARPYDPALPIDLGGTEGVTASQQAAAENLIANTLSHLPRYADPAVAEADGYVSIRDGGTGYEHFIKAEYRDDGRVLDPDRPESLVYQTDPSGGRQLVAAMYMAEPGTTLETVPELGGALTQWHVHGDLCFTPEPDSRVAGLTDAEGNCAEGLVKPEPVPMIHVWITPHACGPFAALDGIAGGQIAEGEARLCDTAHGVH